MIALPYPSHRRSPPFPFSPFFCPVARERKGRKDTTTMFPLSFSFCVALVVCGEAVRSGKGKRYSCCCYYYWLDHFQISYVQFLGLKSKNFFAIKIFSLFKKAFIFSHLFLKKLFSFHTPSQKNSIYSYLECEK